MEEFVNLLGPQHLMVICWDLASFRISMHSFACVCIEVYGEPTGPPLSTPQPLFTQVGPMLTMLMGSEIHQDSWCGGSLCPKFFHGCFFQRLQELCLKIVNIWFPWYGSVHSKFKATAIQLANWQYATAKS